MTNETPYERREHAMDGAGGRFGQRLQMRPAGGGRRIGNIRGSTTGKGVIQLRLDFDSTAIRPRYDHSTAYVTTGQQRIAGQRPVLRHCGLNDL